MIIGLGIDLCPISRMEGVLERHGERIEGRLFTDGERAYARGKAHPATHLAARFAAKEALLKALGVPAGLRWHEIEIILRDRAPELALRGAAGRAALERGVRRSHLSLTHAGDSAVAVVVLEA